MLQELSPDEILSVIQFLLQDVSMVGYTLPLVNQELYNKCSANSIWTYLYLNRVTIQDINENISKQVFKEYWGRLWYENEETIKLLKNGFILNLNNVEQSKDTITNMFQDEVTMEFWLYQDNTETWPVFCALNDETWTNGFGLFGVQEDGLNVIKFYVNDWKDTFVTYNSVSVDKWNHFAGTYNGKTLELYVNGTLHSSKSVDIVNSTKLQMPTSLTSMLTVGFSRWTSQTDMYFLFGSICEIRIWNTARTQHQIRSNMNHKLMGGEKGLVFYLPMNKQSIHVTNNGTMELPDKSRMNWGTLVQSNTSSLPPRFTKIDYSTVHQVPEPDPVILKSKEKKSWCLIC
jgi:hypothetical protein